MWHLDALPRTLTELIAFSCFLGVVSGQYASSFPVPIPLIQRSPYFGSWLPVNNVTQIGGQWPQAWTTRIQAWGGMVRVDGSSWQWQGVGQNATVAEAVYITPTRTIFTTKAGPVTLNITYLSPIEPSDWVRQSFPFSYITFDAWSNDGNSHSVEIYADTTGQFTSSADSSIIQWGTTSTNSSLYHSMSRTAAPSMLEVNQLAEDGTCYFGISFSTPGLTWQTGSYNVTRPYFLAKGNLQSTQGGNPRAINQDAPVTAFSIKLGNITHTSAPIVLALGFVRDPVVRSLKNGGIESRSSFFWTSYKNIGQAIDAFLSDYPAALGRAIAFDSKVMADATAISPAYGDLVATSLRQTMGSIEITTSTQADGKWNTSDVQVFVKDIGVSRRANPVEVIYAAFPTFLYLNASLAGLLLKPLLEYQGLSSYLNNYAASDLGVAFPDAMGNNTNSPLLAVEDCGSMLVMALAHAQKSGEGQLINRHYLLLKKWADYLVSNTLQPSGYMTADGLSNPSMSNLALKGIVGVYAMSKINRALEPQGTLANYTQYYLDKATQYAKDWEGLAFQSDHITTSYGNQGTWGLVYNLFASKLLNTGLVSDKILDAQAAWYVKQAGSAPSFGFEYDGNAPMRAKSHWTMFAAAGVDNAEARDAMVSMILNRLFYKQATRVTPTVYNASSGEALSGVASPAQGAMLALLALKLPSVEITVPKDPESVDLDVAAIAGGVVGGVSAVLLIVLGVHLYRRRKRKQKEDLVGKVAVPLPADGHQEREGLRTAPTPFLASSSVPALNESSKTSKWNNVTGQSRTTEERLTVTPGSAGYAPLSSREQGAGPHSASMMHLHPAPTPHLRDGSSSQSQDTSSSISTAILPTSAADLRTEVELLRREMEELRRQRTSIVVEEPPPMYSGGGENSGQRM